MIMGMWKWKCQWLSWVWPFATPWTVDLQTLLSMLFSRQESWSGLPFPPSTDLPNPGIKPGCPVLQEDSLSSEPPRKPHGGWLFLAWSLPWVSRKNRTVTQGSPSTFPMVAFLKAQSAKSACNTGDLGLIPRLGRSLEKEMATHSRILAVDRGTWWTTTHAQPSHKSWTQISD